MTRLRAAADRALTELLVAAVALIARLMNRQPTEEETR